MTPNIVWDGSKSLIAYYGYNIETTGDGYRLVTEYNGNGNVRRARFSRIGDDMVGLSYRVRDEGSGNLELCTWAEYEFGWEKAKRMCDAIRGNEYR